MKNGSKKAAQEPESQRVLFMLIFLLASCLIFPSAILASAVIGHSNTTTLSTGLVGYWPLDGDTTSWTKDTTQDVSGNGNTGNLTNMSTTTSPVPGKIGGALKFNSALSQVVNATIPSALNNASQASMCGWVYRSSTANKVAFGTGTISDANRFNILWSSNGSIYFQIANNLATEYNFTALAGTGWHHVCVVFNGTQSTNATRVVGYVDGVMKSLSYNVTTPTTLASNANMGMFAIGREIDNGYSTGTIDDVRIYNRALSAAEVAQLYAQGSANIAHSNTTTLSTGLVGYWPFDGDTTNWTKDTTADMSGQGNTGTLVSMSTTTSPVAGKIGQALKLNGGFISGTATPTSNTNLTLSAWVYIPTASQKGTFVHVGGPTSSGTALGIGSGTFDSSGNHLIGLMDGIQWMDFGKSIGTGWHLVTMTFAGGIWKGYVDGVVSTTTFSSGTPTTSGGFLIGEDQTSTPRLWAGSIDDVRIYNRALSAAEVAQLYAQGSAVIAHSNTTTLSTGLVGYWPFDGNTTSWTKDTTQDVSGNGNTGNLTNMSTTTSPVPGKIGGALKFNGTNQYVAANNSSSLQVNTGTVSAWIKTSGCTGTGGYCGIAAKQNAYSIFIMNNVFGLYDWNTTTFRSSGVNVADGKWHFVAASFQSGVTNGTVLYLDGVPKLTTTMTVTNQSLPLEIGSGNATTEYFNGTIDDVRVYNRALSAQEVQQLYLMGK